MVRTVVLAVLLVFAFGAASALFGFPTRLQIGFDLHFGIST